MALPGATIGQLLALSPALSECAACGHALQAPCLLDCLHTVCLRDLAPAHGKVQCPVCRSVHRKLQRKKRNNKKKKNKRW